MPLIEREQELSQIEGLLAEARAGQGMTLLVEGAPGIGKTALLAAAHEEATQHRMRALVARGGELERELVFAIVRQLFEPHLRTASLAMSEDLLAGAAGLATPALHGGTAGDDAASMGTVVHGLYWLCSNLADHGPLLLMVDDVHWADEASLRFVSHLARRITDLPALLILAGRPASPGETGAAARALSGVQPEILRLSPLSVNGVGVLVREALSREAEDDFCRACALASGGNPFLLVEALASLRADGVRPMDVEAHRIERLRPETISLAVLTRLARLGPEAVRLARAIAVLGPTAELRWAAELAELEPRNAAAITDALAHETVIAPTRPLEFVHPLVRTAVYAGTSEALRACAHKRAALMLAAEGVPPERLVHHLLCAEPESDPWVVEALRATASSALNRGAPEPAIACLGRALAEPPDPGERGAILADLGRVQGMANQPDEAAAALQAALELAEHPGARVEITLELGLLMVKTGRGREAIEAFESARRSGDSGDPDLPLRLLSITALGGLASMQPPATWAAELDRVAPGLRGESDVERMILATLAFAAAAAGDRPSHEVARLGALAAAGPLPERDPWLLVNLASAALVIADEIPDALHLLDRGIDAARRQGDAAAFGHLAVLRSHTALYAGRLFEAEADGRAAPDIYEDQSQDAPLAAAVLIDALVDRGAIAAAEGILVERGLEVDQPLSMLIAHFVLMARARLRLRQSRPRDALVDLRTCGEGLTTTGYTNPGFAHWRAEAALAHLALGENLIAGELIAEELDLARKFGAPRAIGIALRIAGLLAGGQRGISLLRESVAILEGSPAELERARSLVDYGGALRRAGQRTVAQEPLRRGLDLAARCGAQGLADRASAQLIAAGARPRRAMLTGPEALTAGELQVVRMAADGGTNREVAQALFVTRRTVEVHLTNAYRKLGIKSRYELRNALDLA